MSAKIKVLIRGYKQESANRTDFHTDLDNDNGFSQISHSKKVFFVPSIYSQIAKTPNFGPT